MESTTDDDRIDDGGRQRYGCGHLDLLLLPLFTSGTIILFQMSICGRRGRTSSASARNHSLTLSDSSNEKCSSANFRTTRTFSCQFSKYFVIMIRTQMALPIQTENTEMELVASLTLMGLKVLIEFIVDSHEPLVSKCLCCHACSGA